MKQRFCIIVVMWLCALSMSAQAKYVFYFIGDGMGANHVMAAQMYLAEQQGRIGSIPLRMSGFPYSGQLSTFSASNGITDSSAAGTCLASGKKTNNHVLGIDFNGENTTSVATELKRKGWRIGIATSVSIDHATPSSFYAHSMDRNDYYTIGSQLPKSGFDFFGGATFYYPQNKKDSTSPNLYDLCKRYHYTIARGYKEAKEMRNAGKMILIQQGEGLKPTDMGRGRIPFSIDKKEGDLTLREITEIGIRHLDNGKPFFLMVEGGAIDWANHSNDAATSIQEVLAFDEAVNEAYQFYLRHPDETLIVVTADHETGGLALGNSDYTLHLSMLSQQKVSSVALSDQIQRLQRGKKEQLTWGDMQKLLTETLGFYAGMSLTKEEDEELKGLFMSMNHHGQDDVKTLYSTLNQLGDRAIQILTKKSKLAWTTKGHTASPVPLFAIGVGAERFAGWHDNSEIAPLLLQAAQ